ncbi:MAG: peptide deformylase [Mariprofundaceae bacterium]|nr:peptide deformylase [Mariprofundaceae bacterium]
MTHQRKARSMIVLPDARLRQMSQSITTFDQNLVEQFTDIETAMRAGPGGVGIAAPQLGDNRRMVVVDCTVARHPCRNHGLLHLVNPEIIEHSDDEILGREGCLSVPDWVGMVSRARIIYLKYQDMQGETHEMETSGFEARVIQHEVDHLDGVLFIDRVVSTHDLVRRMG